MRISRTVASVGYSPCSSRQIRPTSAASSPSFSCSVNAGPRRRLQDSMILADRPLIVRNCGVRPLSCGNSAAKRAQLLRGGDGIGHDQNAAGVDPAAQRQIPQPRDEHRRLPAAGHGQQQNCAVYGLHGGLLLRAEVRHVLGGKFLRRHTSSSSTTGQWSLPSTSARIEAETTRGISRSDTIK